MENRFSSEIIKKIVVAAQLEKSDLVLLHFWGDDKDKYVANSFAEEVAAVGATPFVLQQSREINARIFNRAEDTVYNEKFYSLIELADVVIDIFMYKPVIPSIELKKKKWTCIEHTWVVFSISL